MRKFGTIGLAVAASLFGWMNASVRAGTTEYDVTVNTQSVTGQAGYIDFEFNGSGVPSQYASAMVTNFSTDGTLTPNASDPNQGLYGPDAAGSLTGTPYSLSFDNQTTSNGYTMGITFGSTISFDLTFSGAALDNPDGTGDGVFQLDFFNAAGDFLLTNDPDPPSGAPDFNAMTVQVNPDGTLTPTLYPNANDTPSAVTIAAVPEPTAATLLTGVLAVGSLCRRRA